MIDVSQNQRGNVLFLILIAVALFAALSYAVTSSSRGSGSGKKEDAELAASRIIQEAEFIKQTIMRLKLIEDYKEVIFDDSAPTTNGTCHEGADEITPCKTIGLFHPSVGFRHTYLNKWNERFGTYLESYIYGYTMRSQLNGVEFGTTAPDSVFTIGPIDPDTCKALNKKLTGIDDFIPAWTSFSGGGSYQIGMAFDAPTPYATLANGTSDGDFPEKVYCGGDASWAEFYYVYEEH